MFFTWPQTRVTVVTAGSCQDTSTGRHKSLGAMRRCSAQLPAAGQSALGICHFASFPRKCCSLGKIRRQAGPSCLQFFSPTGIFLRTFHKKIPHSIRPAHIALVFSSRRIVFFGVLSICLAFEASTLPSFAFRQLPQFPFPVTTCGHCLPSQTTFERQNPIRCNSPRQPASPDKNSSPASSYSSPPYLHSGIRCHLLNIYRPFDEHRIVSDRTAVASESQKQWLPTGISLFRSSIPRPPPPTLPQNRLLRREDRTRIYQRMRSVGTSSSSTTQL